MYIPNSFFLNSVLYLGPTRAGCVRCPVKNPSFYRLKTSGKHSCLFVLWLHNIECRQRHQGGTENVDKLVVGAHDDGASEAAVTVVLRVTATVSVLDVLVDMLGEICWGLGVRG